MCRQHGVTLIELMVAMALGLFVAAGVVTVFAATSHSNRAQIQLARLQEEGRFAITSLSRDLRMTNGLYCNNTGGVAQPRDGLPQLDHLRSPKVFARDLVGTAVSATSGALGDVTTAWGVASGPTSYPAAPTTPYSMPSFLFMRGYDCTLTTCTPVDPSAAGLPPMGTNPGDRIRGAAVVTLRYLNSSNGWAVGSTGGSTLVADTVTGGVSSITLNPRSGEPPRTNFANGDLVMLADCSNAQIFAATYSPATGVLTLPDSGNFAGAGPVAPSQMSAPKVFDLNRDFQTVTYYLKVVSVDDNGKPPFTGALMRRINGGLKAGSHGVQPGASEDELVRGIERLDFKYAVEDASGRTSFLSAAQVDGAVDCPPVEIDALTAAGCLWRGVKSVEVSILMDGQIPLYTLGAGDIAYVYAVDGISKPAAPKAHPIKPGDQGFADQMLRREFTALVAVRNYNP
ncbi:PilW family protein [Rhodanobacter sp. C03]|uniref:PilW family protein n=1 Tax=Rhodanobacter sp. C03 TaxID=1945858 RepID=UPI000984322C|nr:PilW family protein [Rhodanobacter sp. C03]OOG57266.1 hypothetical protein B0E48_07330 [Rhodanobacter sp. C03]